MNNATMSALREAYEKLKDQNAKDKKKMEEERKTIEQQMTQINELSEDNKVTKKAEHQLKLQTMDQ